MPISVARGIVCRGSRTSRAGTVADSMPMNAHSLSAAAAVTAPKEPCPLALNGVKLAESAKNGTTSATASSGTSLSTVVTTCTMPPWRTPNALTAVPPQIAASATAAAANRLVASTGQKWAR
nr:hypothetical protein [Qaidamihabitans albus]